MPYAAEIPSGQKVIGLSLSFCIADILRGDISLDEVEKIVTGTLAPNQQEWDEVIRTYQEVYWTDFPAQAAELAARLRAEDRIEQPRLTSQRYPVIANTRHWVTEEDEIEWKSY